MKNKYESKNTLEYIQLHDNKIIAIKEKDEKINIYFEGFDVYKFHPLNSKGYSCYVTNGILEFEVFKNYKIPENLIKGVDIIKDLIVIQEYNKFDGNVGKFGLLVFGNSDGESVQFKIEFDYKNVIISWGEFINKSRFEG